MVHSIMAIYRYIAIDASLRGRLKRTRGEIAADSPYQVRSSLRQMGLLPHRVSLVRRAEPGIAGPLRSRVASLLRDRRSARVAEMFDGLGALLGAGMQLAEALDLLAGTSRSQSATLYRSTAEGVRHGDGLAQVLARHQGWFSAVDVAIVRAAEESGTLAETLGELAEARTDADELRTRLATALAYPALLLVFGVAVVVFLTTVTLPQLAAVLADAQVPLPASTQILLAAGQTLVAYPVPTLAGLAAISVVAVLALRDPRLAYLRLKTPVIGRALMRAQLASTTATLARLLRSGVGFAESITLVGPTLRNPALRKAFEQLQEDLDAGSSISQSLARGGILEPVFCRVIEVGEESGELPATLSRLAARYRGMAKRSVDRLTALLEPATILVLATAVGFVVYAAIAPMLRITQAL